MTEREFETFNLAFMIAGELISSGALALFVSKLLPPKRRKLKTVAVFAAYLFILSASDAASAPSGVSQIALIAAAVLFAPLLKITRSASALYALLYLNTRVQSGIISQSIYYAVEKTYPYPDAPLSAVFLHSAQLITVYIICFSIFFIAMLVLLNRRLAKNPLKDDNAAPLYLCLYPAAGVIFGAVVSRILIEPGNEELLILFDRHPAFQAVFPILAALFYLGAYIMIIWAQKLAYAKENQAMLTIEAQMTKSLEDRIAGLNLEYEKLRTAKHDTANHLNTLNALIECDNKDEALSYIRNWAEDMHGGRTDLSTGNPVADAVVGDFLSKCESSGIKFECEFYFDKGIKIQPYDLGVILSNLLSNAYEACLKLDEGNRYIRLKSRRAGSFYIIETENPAVFTLIEKDGTIASAKPKDGSLHGIGLKSVALKVQKYNGEAMYKYEDGLFFAAVMLQENN